MKITPENIEKFGWDAIIASLKETAPESIESRLEEIESGSYKDRIDLSELTPEQLEEFRKAVRQE